MASGEFEAVVDSAHRDSMDGSVRWTLTARDLIDESSWDAVGNRTPQLAIQLTLTLTVGLCFVL